ncbi:hypothetical protein PAECIP112173_02768 [Paenibacillus sp. JJ-100]|nr:hypothetical protein PAECIP112173_02768 [Paenibacillus sp. JJ-100]
MNRLKTGLANAEYMSKQAPIDISDEGLKAWSHQ